MERRQKEVEERMQRLLRADGKIRTRPCPLSRSHFCLRICSFAQLMVVSFMTRCGPC